MSQIRIGTKAPWMRSTEKNVVPIDSEIVYIHPYGRFYCARLTYENGRTITESAVPTPLEYEEMLIAGIIKRDNMPLSM